MLVGLLRVGHDGLENGEESGIGHELFGFWVVDELHVGLHHVISGVGLLGLNFLQVLLEFGIVGVVLESLVVCVDGFIVLFEVVAGCAFPLVASGPGGVHSE